MYKVKIARARKADFKLIANYYGKTGDAPWDPFCSARRMASIPRRGFLIASVGEAFAGFLYWFEGKQPWFDKDVKRYAHIEEVHTAQKFRDKGVGKMLLKTALTDIRRLGIKTVYIDTTEDNSVARHLYEKASFKIIGKTLHYKMAKK